MRGPLNKVGLADRPPHPKFAERISTSPRKRGEVNQMFASISKPSCSSQGYQRRCDGLTVLEPCANAFGEISLPPRPLAKRKGLQLALEPLNGRGIAGYVPEP